MAARSKSAPHVEKICEGCARPFAWRKKWERCWEQVRYCSERCRRGQNRKAAQEAAALEAAIRERLAQSRGTICPSEAARAVFPGAWRERMNQTRAVARKMAARNEILFTQKGREVDPGTARGPIRLSRVR
ncbi:MAG: DUF3253 domain-containing protein [Myxococcota bacterium]